MIVVAGEYAFRLWIGPHESADARELPAAAVEDDLCELRHILHVSHSRSEATVTFVFNFDDALHRALTEIPAFPQVQFRHCRMRFKLAQSVEQSIAGPAQVCSARWDRTVHKVLTATTTILFVSGAEEHRS